MMRLRSTHRRQTIKNHETQFLINLVMMREIKKKINKKTKQITIGRVKTKIDMQIKCQDPFLF